MDDSGGNHYEYKYMLGIVNKITVSNDGNVRCTTVCYVLISDTDNVKAFGVQRSVQRLPPIHYIEEQSDSVAVKEHEFYIELIKYYLNKNIRYTIVTSGGTVTPGS